MISSFLANEKDTTNWVIGNKLGWLTRSPASLATLLSRLSAQPAVLKRYQENIKAMHLPPTRRPGNTARMIEVRTRFMFFSFKNPCRPAVRGRQAYRFPH